MCDLVNRANAFATNGVKGREGGREADFDGRRKGRRKEQNKLTQERKRDQTFARSGSSSVTYGSSRSNSPMNGERRKKEYSPFVDVVWEGDEEGLRSVAAGGF